jgi:hypothetical protein
LFVFNNFWGGSFIFDALLASLPFRDPSQDKRHFVAKIAAQMTGFAPFQCHGRLHPRPRPESESD